MSRCIMWGLSVLVVSLGFVPATRAADLRTELRTCAASKDSLSRLACYDKLAQQSRLAGEDAGMPVKPRQKTAADNKTATAAGGNQADNFGKAHLQAVAEVENGSMFSVIDKVQELHYGKLALTLTNGQVWHQTDNNKLLLEAGDKVELMEGMLSAIYLRKDGLNKRIRVKRIK
ncbi:hypothetical protein SG34_000560 [Thalassomonas viridans]|uniref:Type II secretion system protein GspC N-terminal domain-containing protein n=1 Tax=Thalassomonas viridans TaxID=137584 RepID=A0AAF0C9H5_9GAMM|nr:hypothetical protein [Thalassomonas viridans]WDE05476.1 hypothetical protein SG34_000560 [Thalassomonas viridans]